MQFYLKVKVHKYSICNVINLIKDDAKVLKGWVFLRVSKINDKTVRIDIKIWQFFDNKVWKIIFLSLWRFCLPITNSVAIILDSFLSMHWYFQFFQNVWCKIILKTEISIKNFENLSLFGNPDVNVKSCGVELIYWRWQTGSG